MKFDYAGGRVLLTGIALALACPAYAVERSGFSPSIELSSRADSAGEALGVNYPTDGALLGNQGQATDFDAERVERRVVKIGEGQTIADVLHAAGVSRTDAAAAARALRSQTDLRRLQIGQRVTLYVEPLPRPVIGAVLIGLALDVGNGTDAVAFRDFNNKFTGRRAKHEEAMALLDSIVVVDTAQDAQGSSSLVNRDFVLRASQSIFRLLVESGASKEDGLLATNILAQEIDMRRLVVGQKFTATFETFPDGRPARLAGLAITMPDGQSAVVGRNEDGKWHSGPASLGKPTPTDAVDDKPMHPVPDEARSTEDPAEDEPAVAGAEPATSESPDAASEMAEDLARIRAWFETADRTVQPPEATVRPDAPTEAAEAEEAPEEALQAVETADAGSGAQTETRTVVLERGDGLFNRLVEAGATRQEALVAVKDLGKVINLRQLRIGETFRLTFSTPPDGGTAQLTGLSVNTKRKELVVLGWPLRGVETQVAEADAAQPAAEAKGTESESAATPTESVVEHAVLPLHHEYRISKVARGDSLFGLLRSAGASQTEISLATRSLRRIFNPNRLQAGHNVIVEIEHTDDGARLIGMTLQTGKNSGVKIKRNQRDQFTAHKLGNSAFKQAVAVAEAQTAARAAAEKNGTLPKAEVAEADADDLDTRINGYEVVDLAEGLRTTVTLARGATLMETLMSAGSTRDEAHAVIASVKQLFDPRRLQAGQSVSLTFVNATTADPSSATASVHKQLAGLSLNLDTQNRLDVVRLDDGGFMSGFVERELVRDYRRVEGEIKSSLYLSADKAGVPRPVLMDLIRIYSFDVDFQRDVQRGDRFEILYETFVDDQGTPVKPGDVLYSELTIAGDEKPLYRYELADGRVDYFDEKGESSRKALMRTPIDGARLSSRFGMRKHPVLGYSKMHKGIDFAASSGTPIYAAGDGVVERASRFGAYGNYVRIRHNADYTTAYAHMKKFAKGIYPGKRVRQGETIGYVGTTGRSTGPHLHYEVHYRNKHVNPLSVKIPTGIRLAEADRPGFMAERDRVATLFQELPIQQNVAENQTASAE